MKTIFDAVEFKTAMKKLAKEYDDKVRNKENRSSVEQQSTNNANTTGTTKRFGDLTDAEWNSMFRGVD